jgi:hypothetical protein
VRTHSASRRATPPEVDLGPAISYLTLTEGTPVYDRLGRRIGVVEQIAADTSLDIFDGLMIHTEPLPGRHLFASVDRIAELHERGVLLSAEADALPPPPAPRSGERRGDARPEGWLHALARRAWDRISGR